MAGTTLAEMRMEAALDYATRGLAVGPLRGKRPLVDGGYKAFSSDVDTVRRWWQRYPGANIGARPGRGIVVLDIDIRNGGHETWQLITASFAVPETMAFMTGSGGWHLWFTVPYLAPLRSELVHRGSGIDIKHGGAGYVVMAPSVHPETGGLYVPHTWTDIAPLPKGLLQHVFKPLPRPTTPGRVVVHADDAGAGLVRFVAELADGNRNNGLYWAARRALDSGLDIEAQLSDAARAVGLADAEIIRTLASARTAARGTLVGGAA
ncbi:bifunctional DNA primase/polymerase [Corynebacterium lizhenjunii]|nr:bifunctional DNA primase/polymerase [Corynebacterium lizhenjunii]